MKYNGTAWVEEASPVGSSWLYSVDFCNVNSGWACRFGDNDSFATVLRYNGKEWINYSKNIEANFFSVSCSDSNRAIIVGMDFDGYGTAFHFNDSVYKKESMKGMEISELKSVVSIDSNHAWAVAYMGDILFYDGACLWIQCLGIQ